MNRAKGALLLITALTLSLTATGAPAQDVTQLQSYNYPDHYIRHSGFLGEITPLTTQQDEQDSLFRVVPGLAGGPSVSFESVNYPGHYLRHQNFRVKLDNFSGDDLFRADASFVIRPGLADGSWVSFESINYPGHYIRHRDFHLYLERGSDDIFRKDVTFRMTAGGGYNPYGR